MSAVAGLFLGGSQRFFLKGTNERWRGIFRDEDLALYDATVQAMLPPECAKWVASGRLESGDEGTVGRAQRSQKLGSGKKFGMPLQDSQQASQGPGRRGFDGVAPIVRSAMVNEATREGRTTLAMIRCQELDGFVEELLGDEQTIGLPERAHRGLETLGEIRALMAAVVQMARDETKAATNPDLQTSLRNVREKTKIAKHEIHAVILSCTRSSADALNIACHETDAALERRILGLTRGGFHRGNACDSLPPRR
jgi:hypothetical protein